VGSVGSALISEPTLTGKAGGRTESLSQPKRNCAAPPQIRPWQVPMPQRVCSLAALRRDFFAQLDAPYTGEALFDCLTDLTFFIKNLRGESVVVNQELVARCRAPRKARVDRPEGRRGVSAAAGSKLSRAG
jgi:hypothetical protein